MNKYEWIILMLHANNQETIYGITRFEKLLFYYLNLFMKNDLNEFNFKPYNFGPHSDKIRDILYTLRDRGLIAIRSQRSYDFLEFDDPEENEEEILPINYAKQEIYKLKNKGEIIAEKIIAKHKPNVDNLSSFKNKLNNIPLRSLIQKIYREYPNMTTKSIIKERIFKLM